jgi:hypothetical protein
MSDPVAEAAANLNDAAPSSTEPVVAQEVGTPAVGEISAGSAAAAPVDTSAMTSVADVASGETQAAAELSNAASPADSAPAQESTGEHPHTSILRRLTETLRRKWNVFDGELEAILKDAESHL